METRKVQRTGKSTYIVSLPKAWTKKNDIKAGSLLYITQSDNGALVLSADRSEPDLSIRLQIDNKADKPLIRDLIGCYIAGYRTIEVSSKHMTQSQKKDIHSIVQKLIGPEILEETGSKVVIQDLLNSVELQAEKALRRIKTIVRSMIQDSIEALLKSDRELAEDVIQRDDDVDRIYLLILRQFTGILRSGSVKQETLDPITVFNYMQAAYNLERMADHALRIAEQILKCDSPIPKEMVDEISRMEPLFLDLVDESITSLIQLNSEKANEIIEQSAEIRSQSSQIPSSFGINERSETQIRLVISSIERMLDYIKNIGELTINLSQARIGEDQ